LQIPGKKNHAADFEAIDQKLEILIESGPVKANHQTLAGQLLV
jgi:hypothetical protein